MRKNFLNKASEAQARRQRMCEFHDIKIKDFCPVKDTRNRVNREMTGQEEKWQGQ